MFHRGAPQVEFFFDCSSPWTYLAFEGIGPLCRRLGAKLSYRPILVGGVFNAVNRELYDLRANQNPRKAQYYQEKDLQDWARIYGVQITFPPPVFPVNSAKAMRGALLFLGDSETLEAYCRKVFHAYWGDLQDIAQVSVLREIFRSLGERTAIDVDSFAAQIQGESCRRALRQNTEELVVRGGFGSPTMFLNANDMYFGNDRLPLLESAIRAIEKQQKTDQESIANAP